MTTSRVIRQSLRLLLTCFLTLEGPMLFAQQPEDSLRIRHDSVPATKLTTDSTFTLSPKKEAEAEHPAVVPSIRKSIELERNLYPPYHTDPSPMHRGDYSVSGIMASLGDDRYLFGAGQQVSTPGIGRFNAAALGYGQQLLDERLKLQLAIEALKINTVHFTNQAFGASGMLLYQASDRLHFRTFAGVNFGNFGTPPAYILGGSMGMGFTDRFGIEIGAQSFYNPATGRWDTRPIVMPYYNFDHFKLQIDIGGLLYEILRNVLHKDRGRFSPTIRPNVPGFNH